MPEPSWSPGTVIEGQIVVAASALLGTAAVRVSAPRVKVSVHVPPSSTSPPTKAFTCTEALESSHSAKVSATSAQPSGARYDSSVATSSGGSVGTGSVLRARGSEYASVVGAAGAAADVGTALGRVCWILASGSGRSGVCWIVMT